MKKYITIIFCLVVINAFPQKLLKNNLLQVEEIRSITSKITKLNYSKSDTLFDGVEYVNCKCLDTLNVENDSCYLLLRYNEGELVQKDGFYETGEKMMEYFYKEGKIVKIAKEWYRGKKNKMIRNYYEPWSCPSGKYWFKNGQLKMEFTYEGEIGTNKSWYENGQLEKIADNNKDGTTKSYEKRWCKNGNIISVLKLNQGRQRNVFYYCNGNKMGEGTMIDFGLFWVGEKTEYYKNGKKSKEMYFQNGNTREEANIETGTWRYYSEKGDLIKEKFYKYGELIDTKEYLPLNNKLD